jgi:hypothetical protein
MSMNQSLMCIKVILSEAKKKNNKIYTLVYRVGVKKFMNLIYFRAYREKKSIIARREC